MSKVYQCGVCSSRFETEESRFSGPETLCPACGKIFPTGEFAEITFCPHCRHELAIGLNVSPGTTVHCPTCGGEFRTAGVTTDFSAAANFSPMLNPGDFFDKYRIERLLGRGGMGEVYLARHRIMDRQCALKILTSGIGGDSVSAARFVQEAKLANRISHPNIISVFDVGTELKTGRLFIAMEYVDGESLSSLMETRRFSEKELLSIGIGVCEALAVMEQYGIVHRDIKPSNIMLDRAEHVKLADLGIAKSDNRQYGDITLTRGAEVFGTPEYASPEQCRAAHDADCRSDIYSLGATLYHLACGEPPYDGDTSLEIVLKVLKEDPVSLKERNSALSDGFAALIGDMMRRDPAQRPQHAAELIDRMRDLLRTASGAVPGGTPGKAPGGSRTGTAPCPEVRRKIPRRGLALLLAGLIVLGAGAWLFRSGYPSPSAPAPKPAPKKTPAPEKTSAPKSRSAAANTGTAASPLPYGDVTFQQFEQALSGAPVSPANAVPETSAPKKETSAPKPEAPVLPPAAAKKTEDSVSPPAVVQKPVEPVPPAVVQKPVEPAPPAVMQKPAEPAPQENGLPGWLTERIKRCEEMLDSPEVKKNPARRAFFRQQLELLEQQAVNRLRAQDAAKRDYSAENTRAAVELFAKVAPLLWRKNASASPEYKKLAALLKDPRTDPNVKTSSSAYSSLVTQLAGRSSGPAAEELLKILLARYPLLAERYASSHPRLVRYGVPKIVFSGGGNADMLETCLLAGISPETTVQNNFKRFSAHREEKIRERSLPLLHFAVLHGWNGTVSMLISAGADVNRTDDEGQTVLHYAYKYGYGRRSLIKPMIDAGCDPERRDGRGRLAREYSAMPPLYRACFDRDLDRMKKQVRTKDDANILLENGQSALEWNGFGDDPKTALLLLERGADPMRPGIITGATLSLLPRIESRLSFNSPNAVKRLPEMELRLRIIREILDRPGGYVYIFHDLYSAARLLAQKPLNAQFDALQQEYRKIAERTIQEIPDTRMRDTMQQRFMRYLESEKQRAASRQPARRRSRK